MTREIQCHVVKKSSATNAAVTMEIDKVIAFEASPGRLKDRIRGAPERVGLIAKKQMTADSSRAPLAAKRAKEPNDGGGDAWTADACLRR